MVFDATFIRIKNRKKYIRLAKKNNASVVCIYCSTPPDIILHRNAQRNEFRKVPEFVVKNMIEKFEEPTKEEGFDFIIKYDTIKDEFFGDFIDVSKMLEVN